MIVACQHTHSEYISPIFVRPKKDNKLRVILNLKNLNGRVENHHFKKETLKHALALVLPFKKKIFFCSMDLRNAYFSVHINDESLNFFEL